MAGDQEMALCEPGAPKRDDQFFLLDLKGVGWGELPFPAASSPSGDVDISVSSKTQPSAPFGGELGGPATEG